jgi:hypothetical protein
MKEAPEEKLGPIIVNRKSGTERFHNGDKSLDFDLLSFWRWISSDLVSNATRGILAEYLVARAIGIGINDIRSEWDRFDLTTKSGIKIEVKSAAYIQTWHQDRYSPISFGIAQTQGWDPKTGKFSKLKQRHADVYVFALLDHKDQETIDPTDVRQWAFYVVPTHGLNRRKRSQHSITLASIEREFGKPVSYAELKNAIARVGR